MSIGENEETIDLDSKREVFPAIHLPPELIIEILEFLNFFELRSPSLVSRQWFAATLTDPLWKFYYLANYPLPDPTTRSFLNQPRPKFYHILPQDLGEDKPFSPFPEEEEENEGEDDGNREEVRSPSSQFFCEFSIGIWRKRFLSRYLLNKNFYLGRISKSQNIENPNGDEFTKFERTPDKKYIICGTSKGFLICFNMKFQILFNSRIHRDRIREIIIFSGSTVNRLVEPEEEEEEENEEDNPKKPSFLLTCGNDFTIQLFQLNLSSPNNKLKILAKKSNREFGWYRCMQIIPRRKNVNRFPSVVTGDYRNIKFHRIHVKSSKIVTFKTLQNAHEKAVLSLRVITSLHHKKLETPILISGGEDSFVYIWDLTKHTILRSFRGVGFYFHELIMVNPRIIRPEEEEEISNKICMIALSKEVRYLETSIEEGADTVVNSEVVVKEMEDGYLEDYPTAFCVWEQDRRIFIVGTILGNICVFYDPRGGASRSIKKSKSETPSFSLVLSELVKNNKCGNSNDGFILLWKSRVCRFDGGAVRNIRVFGEKIYVSVSDQKSKNSVLAILQFHWVQRKRGRKGKLVLKKKKIKTSSDTN